MINKLKSNSKYWVKYIIVAIIFLVICFIGIATFKCTFNQGDEIVFNDNQFKIAIEKALGDNHITADDVINTKSLRLENIDLNDATSDLLMFTNLEELYIINCNIESLDNIVFPDKVKILDLSSNKINNLSTSKPYKNYQNIEILSLNNNHISYMDMDTIGLSKLKEINMQECNLTGNVDLGTLNSVENVNLNNNSIESISGDIPNVKKLLINNNNISDLNFLLKYTTLIELEISDNSLTTISPIIDLKNLRRLDIRSNDIATVRGIEALNNLEAIYMDKNVDRKEIDFMKNSWKNGDIYTKQYFLKEKYNVDVR